MGGLRRAMPWTWLTFLAGALALTGVPPLSGFWSKDAILDAAWMHPQTGFGKPFFALLLIGAFLTAFYMTRLHQVVFEGEWRGGARAGAAHDGHDHGKRHGPHESPPVMLGPSGAWRFWPSSPGSSGCRSPMASRTSWRPAGRWLSTSRT